MIEPSLPAGKDGSINSQPLLTQTPTAFSAFGATSSARHIVPPGQAAKRSPRGPDSPSVLLPERMHIFLGGTPAKRFAPDLAPVCGLQGTRADTFVSHHRQVPAAANYAAVLTERLRSNVVVVRGTELPGDEPALIW